MHLSCGKAIGAVIRADIRSRLLYFSIIVYCGTGRLLCVFVVLG